uniref:Uncharacterized protein n=1 Tax=Rhizophora mucronata TaxID=61149 RepID=A0A2P2PLB3_RHIMU
MTGKSFLFVSALIYKPSIFSRKKFSLSMYSLFMKIYF